MDREKKTTHIGRTVPPMVSIIIPVYKAEAYLPTLFKCLRNQTYRNIEVLLIEDGSPDHSGKMLDNLAGMDNRFHVIHQKNSGTAEARNRGIKAATGKYLMFMDDDDRIPKTYVEEYVSAIEKMHTDIVIGGYRRVAGNGRILRTRRLVKRSSYPDRGTKRCAWKDIFAARSYEWLKFIQIAPWAKIYRTGFVRNAEAEFLPYTYGEDIYFQMMLYASHPKIGYIPSVSYQWMSWDTSVTNTLHKGIQKKADIFPMLDKLLTVYPERDPFFRYFLYRHCAYHIFSSGQTADSRKLKTEIRQCRKWLDKHDYSLALNPFSPMLRGELMRDRVAVAAIWLVTRLHLEGLFARLYGSS